VFTQELDGHGLLPAHRSDSIWIFFMTTLRAQILNDPVRSIARCWSLTEEARKVHDLRTG